MKVCRTLTLRYIYYVTTAFFAKIVPKNGGYCTRGWLCRTRSRVVINRFCGKRLSRVRIAQLRDAIKDSTLIDSVNSICDIGRCEL